MNVPHNFPHSVNYVGPESLMINTGTALNWSEEMWKKKRRHDGSRSELSFYSFYSLTFSLIWLPMCSLIYCPILFVHDQRTCANRLCRDIWRQLACMPTVATFPSGISGDSCHTWQLLLHSQLHSPFGLCNKKNKTKQKQKTPLTNTRVASGHGLVQ